MVRNVRLSRDVNYTTFLCSAHVRMNEGLTKSLGSGTTYSYASEEFNRVNLMRLLGRGGAVGGYLAI